MITYFPLGRLGMKRFGKLGSWRLWAAILVLGICPVAMAQAQSAKALPDKAPAEKTAAEKADDEKKQKERDAEYYELLKLFADTLDQVDRNYVKDVSRRELMEA